jgi:hypothetical protein
VNTAPGYFFWESFFTLVKLINAVLSPYFLEKLEVKLEMQTLIQIKKIHEIAAFVTKQQPAYK